MREFTVIGIGEVLWDMLQDGKQLGGAPANFAFHAQNLGASSTIISAVGNDIHGREIKQAIESEEISFLMNISPKPTGTVDVNLHNGIPSYVIQENVAWDEIILNEKAITKLKKADAVCFGSLAQRCDTSKYSIRTAVKMVPKESLKVFDINLRQGYYSQNLIRESIQLANILKLNSEELVILGEYFNLDANNETACKQLVEQFDLRLVALTNGSENSLLVTKETKSEIPTPKVIVADTVGAGDSFTATLVVGLLKGESLKEVHQKAVFYSAIVCMNKGATPKIEM